MICPTTETLTYRMLRIIHPRSIEKRGRGREGGREGERRRGGESK